MFSPKLYLLIFLFLFSFTSHGQQEITVGSKMFPESYILGEIAAQLLESEGYKVRRKLGLGGTLLAYEALTNGAISVYPEYTGTISEVILKSPSRLELSAIEAQLQPYDVLVSPTLGFNNTYAIAVTEELADERSLTAISDLAQTSDLRAALSFEFVERRDGWRKLKEVYGLNLQVKSLDHVLAYEAMAAGSADVMDVYSTDAKIAKMGLVVLEDDKKFFPPYDAVYLVGTNAPPPVLKILSRLEGRISEDEMRKMNDAADRLKQGYPRIAREFLQAEGLIEASSADVATSPMDWKGIAGKILRLTGVHLYLVFLSTLMAALVAVPLGILLFRTPVLAKPILGVVGLLQTIPSIALLVYMIPWLGVTVEAALMALFLYSLLPILQNTYSGLKSVDPVLVQAARGIGLYPREILFSVELPLAMPILVAGVRTAAVINVGMATIAAFIGSGGLGELIVQGLTLNDIWLMQQGAIPAAGLAVVINILFNVAEKRLARE